MSLAPGVRLGPYEILAAIGAGGMGEVYKARDTRLNRTVAIKVLPAHDAGAESRVRLEREARAISSLDHPNICALYDVGQHEDAFFIVMQYLEGQTLAERLKKGPLPIDVALRLAIEIAGALEHAHRAGIVHRDLKPANVMLTGSSSSRGVSTSKLLDFGLAKPHAVIDLAGQSGATRLAASPVTAAGVILGTVEYMSPEQIEGKPVDARSDLFAFGVMLHEMIAGARPFAGPTPASIIGSILKDTPPSITERQPDAPPALAHVIETCVAKDPDDRWQTASDVKRELRWIQSALSAPDSRPRRPRAASAVSPAWRLAAIALLIALGALAVAVLSRWTAPPDAGVVRFEIFPPAGMPFAGVGASVPTTQFAVSPDGHRVVFVAGPTTGRPALWVRALDATQAQMLAGTEDATNPFWSPDSRYIGFFALGKLKKVEATGGTPQALCDVAPDTRGGTWSRDDVILFSRTTNAGLDQISATGGVPTPVLTLRPGESSYRWPSFLPDGRHFLFHVRAAAKGGVYIGSLDDKTSAPLIEHALFNAIFSSGYLLTMRGGTLLAYPFDERRLRLTGEPIRVAEQVSGSSAQLAAFSVSASGVLAYSTGLTVPSRPEWFDRTGKPLGAAADVGDYVNLRLSPDERRLAFGRVDPQTKTSDVWVVDVSPTMIETRFTSDPGVETAPVWSPDGTRIVYRSDRAGGNFLFQKPVSLAEPDKQVATFDAPFPTDWSSDGRFIAFHGPTSTGAYSVMAIDMQNPAKPIPVNDSPFTELDGHFSPDGKSIAYASDVSGRLEIYVQAFPRSASPTRVSTNGGTEPHWRQDGRELYYLAPDRTMMAVHVTIGASIEHDAPHALFQTRARVLGQPYRMNYDVSRDGSRFLIITPVEGASAASSINVVLNWQADLHKK